MSKRRRLPFTSGAYRAAAKAAEKRAGQWLDRKAAAHNEAERFRCWKRAASAMDDCNRWREKAKRIEIEELM